MHFLRCVSNYATTQKELFQKSSVIDNNKFLNWHHVCRFLDPTLCHFWPLWNHTKVLITLIIPFFPSFYFGVFFFKTWTWPEPKTNPTRTLSKLYLNSTQPKPDRNPTQTWPNSTQKLPWIQPVPFLNITWILHKPDLTWPNLKPET